MQSLRPFRSSTKQDKCDAVEAGKSVHNTVTSVGGDVAVVVAVKEDAVAVVEGDSKVALAVEVEEAEEVVVVADSVSSMESIS